MMVQCQPVAFTFICLLIYRCLARPMKLQVCLSPSLSWDSSWHLLNLLMILNSWQYPGWLSFVHSSARWNDPKNVRIAKISQNRGEKSRSVTHECRKVSEAPARQGQGGTKRSEGGEVKESEMGEDTLEGGDRNGSGHPCCLRDPSAPCRIRAAIFPASADTWHCHDSVTKCTLVTLAHVTTKTRCLEKSHNRELHTNHNITSILWPFCYASHHSYCISLSCNSRSRYNTRIHSDTCLCVNVW